MSGHATLRAGDWVQVRSKEEILGTLDEHGRLDGLPFMPEMLAFCGQPFRVASRAHKTCDPPSGLAGRRMIATIHLEGIRCDGTAHGGCQARCLVFWKEAWVRPATTAQPSESVPQSGALAQVAPARRDHPNCTEAVIESTACNRSRENDGSPVFVCQSTELPVASVPIRWWDLRQYIEDYTSGNVTPARILGSFIAFAWQQAVNAGLGLGTPLRTIYDAAQRLHGGAPYPWRRGTIPPGARTPSAALNLQPGEFVRVKSYEEILDTVTEDGMNRGMSFDAEMVPYCGGVYRVLDRVSRIIDEKTGQMRYLKNDCIILDQVVCTACYAQHRRFCPRRIYPYWREIWLERLSPERSA